MRRTHIKFIVVPYVIKWLINLIALTCRVRWHNKAALDKINSSDKAAIISMWHNCSTISGWVMRNSDYTVLVSDSRDGEYVARLSKLFNIDTIRGSSSKGSARAVRDGLKLLRANKKIAITPDGPRGPRYKVQSGVLWFAASCNAPILPLHIEADRQWVLNSWDKHRFPKPFSTIHISVGQPIIIERRALEENINRVTNEFEKTMMDNVSVIKHAITHRTKT